MDDRIVVEAPEPEAQYHTVVSGDTLSKIARTVYGDAMKYPVIFEANKPMLKDPDRIRLLLSSRFGAKHLGAFTYVLRWTDP